MTGMQIWYTTVMGGRCVGHGGARAPPPQFFLKIGKIYRRAPPDFGHDH